MQALQEKKPINTVVKFGNGNYCSLINDGSHFSYLVNTLNGDGLEEALELKKMHMRMNDGSDLRIKCPFNMKCNNCYINKDFEERIKIKDVDSKEIDETKVIDLMVVGPNTYALV